MQKSSMRASVRVVYLTAGLLTSPLATADAGQTYGIPTGSTISVTTADSTLVTWPAGDPLNPLNKPHHQIRADETYTAQSINLYPPGFQFNPQGAIGIRRYFQSRTHNTYSLGSPSSINVLTKDMPANSRFNQAQNIQNFGPYAPDESTFTANTLAANDVYGVETIELVFDAPARDCCGNVITNACGNPTTVETVLDYQKIDIYEPKSSDQANFYVQNFQQKQALNTNTTKSYLGDPPRVIMTTSSTIYPGAQVSVVIYPGSAQSSPPANAIIISGTVYTASGKDETSYPGNIFIEIGNYITGSGIYTLQAMQTSSTNTFGTETFGPAASFSIRNSYNVNSQLGMAR